MIAAIPTIIAKLIPRLASNHDGEVVATVRAIIRSLDSSGLDLHDLAARLSGEKVVREETTREETAGDGKWPDIVAWCLSADRGRLSSREREFLSDMTQKLRRWGDPTEKQAAWIMSIHRRLK